MPGAARPKPPVSEEEKKELLANMTKIINALGEVHEKAIMKIIVANTSVQSEDDTVEVDLQQLGDDTLRELQIYVKKTLQNKVNRERVEQWEQNYE